MMSFTVSVDIHKPVGIVVSALMNPNNFPYWQNGLDRFEVISGKPGEVGSVAHLHYSENGKTYVMEDKLISCEPGKKYVSEVSGAVLTARVETNLVSSKNNTRMTLTWTGRGKIFLLKICLPLLKGKMIRQSQKELETFKQLVETKEIDFSS